MDKRTAVLSDFDGTLTDMDAPLYLLENYAQGDWVEVERMIIEGAIGVEEGIRRQLDLIGLGLEGMIRALDEVVCPRDGLDDLLRHCRSEGYVFEVTSAGLDFYIRHFLEQRGWGDIAVTAPRCERAADGLRVTLPICRYTDVKNFKEDRAKHYQELGYRVVYMGDGASDLPAAARADLALLIRGGDLELLMRNSSTPHHVIDDLSEAVDLSFGRDGGDVSVAPFGSPSLP